MSANPEPPVATKDTASLVEEARELADALGRVPGSRLAANTIVVLERLATEVTELNQLCDLAMGDAHRFAVELAEERREVTRLRAALEDIKTNRYARHGWAADVATAALDSKGEPR